MKDTTRAWHIGTPAPNGLQTIGTGKGLLVAVVATGLDMPTLANARIIAAAPEFMEMLKECHDKLVTILVYGVQNDTADKVWSLIQKHRSVMFSTEMEN